MKSKTYGRRLSFDELANLFDEFSCFCEDGEFPCCNEESEVFEDFNQWCARCQLAGHISHLDAELDAARASAPQSAEGERHE